MLQHPGFCNWKPILFALIFFVSYANAQDADRRDSVSPHPVMVYSDTALRIINLNPYFNLHVDSTLSYDLRINRDSSGYYWFLRNSPFGFRIDKNTGLLYFKADKSYFKSGRLKYDFEYKVLIGVQNLQNPLERIDTSFIIVFYSTEINTSRLKPTVSNNLLVEEGDSVQFKVQCENGTFPIEQVTMNTSIPLNNYINPTACDGEFKWWVPYDFIKDSDTTRLKTLTLQLIGADKFFNKDTATIRISVKPGIDYPQKYAEHQRISKDLTNYVLNLKLTFYVLNKTIKSNKKTRTAFDISSSSTALAGTVLSTAGETVSAKNFGKVLPSVGLTLVPVKEAVAPNKIQEQNTASQVRALAKKLEYLVGENSLAGNRDPDVLTKTKKIQEELRQARVQLIDLPMVEFDEKITPKDAESYFRDPKVNKRYKLKVN